MVWFLAFAPVRTVRLLFLSKITTCFHAKDSRNVLTELRSIFGIHYTLFVITFTVPPKFAIHIGCLGTRGSVETGVGVLVTDFHGKLALQTGVSLGTVAKHANARLDIAFTFPRQQLGFVVFCVCSELAFAMFTFSTVVTVQIAGKIISSP